MHPDQHLVILWNRFLHLLELKNIGRTVSRTTTAFTSFLPTHRVIVEYDLTSWTRRDPPLGSGTRTQHTSSPASVKGTGEADQSGHVVRPFEGGRVRDVALADAAPQLCHRLEA